MSRPRGRRLRPAGRTDARRRILPLAVALAAVACIVWPPGAPLLAAGLAVASLAAVRLGDRATADAALAWCFTAVSIAVAYATGIVWPVPGVVALVPFALLRWRDPVCGWLRRGTHDRVAVVLAIVSVPLTTLALVAFIASGRTDVATVAEPLQDLPSWMVVAAGVGFSLANPAVEEALFRGVLQPSLSAAYGVGPGIVLQAAAFGAVHWAGVPGGGLGMAMAAGWALVLGVVRHRSGTLRLVWAAHVAANATIYTTIVVLARRDGVLQFGHEALALVILART